MGAALPRSPECIGRNSNGPEARYTIARSADYHSLLHALCAYQREDEDIRETDMGLYLCVLPEQLGPASAM